MTEQAQTGAETAAVPAAPGEARTKAGRNFGSQAWYFLRRWPVIPLIIMAVLLVAGIFPGVLAPEDPIRQFPHFRTHPPTWGAVDEHSSIPEPQREDFENSGDYSRAIREYHPRFNYILGGDNLGRDVLSRVVAGARISLQVAVIALVSGVLIGTTMGILGGYFGGWTDEVLMRFVDMWNALPFILIALVVSVTFGATTGVVMLLLAMLAWTPFVRQVRADALGIRSRDYVLAAKIAGATNIRIMLRHLLPGTFSTVLVVASLRVGTLILAESILSFLGVGIPDPIPAWGKSVSEGRNFLREAWWISFFPGFAIFLVVLSLNFFGDWLRDRLDPRLRQLD
ncbi:MAG: ABC transporter permease [Dehalococcoidia bacterium]